MKNLKILMISSGLDRCGIKDYTNRLLEEMKNYRVNIHQIRITENDRKNPWKFILNVLRKISKEKFDILHFQHEFSMYDKFYGITIIITYLLLKMMSKFKRFKIVTTLHTIWDLENLKSSINPKIASSPLYYLAKLYIKYHIKLICMLSNNVIVLGAPSVKILEKQYNIDKKKINYISLGVYCINKQSDKIQNIDISYIKEKFNLINSKVVTLFGFLYPTKGYHYVIEAFPQVIKKNNNVKLVIAGGIPSSDDSSTYEYYRYLKNLVKSLNLEEHVIFTGYIPDEELFGLFKCTDIFLFPYENRVNASAAINMVLPFKKPILVSKSPLFNELVEYNAAIQVDVRNKNKLSEKILLLLEDDYICVKLSKNMEKYTKENSIKSSALKHIKLYESLFIGDKKT